MNLFTTLQHLIPQEKLSELAGRLASARHPWAKRVIILSFAKAYGIKLDDYQRKSLAEYDSFNDFFTRELNDNARPIDQTAKGIICPADGTISQLGHIHDEQIMQAKSHTYSVGQLLADYDDGNYFVNGSFATVYLAPSNYHRVHMPFDGTLVETRYVPGSLFSVNNTTAENVPDLFARNERLVCLFDTEHGKAAVVLVGAMIVAGIETVATGKIERQNTIKTETHNMALKKGEELGRFYLGSTAIVVMPKAAGTDWLANIEHGTTVQMGQLIGKMDI
ncbi:archaetidylserine decarboxylase [Psychrobacter sp. HD31]|uniref:archaetidylserine decarboxylase n=1 Tax=Psychrobacter sp. HD31 TaxID=3112003 RepID=UPI003DA3338C